MEIFVFCSEGDSQGLHQNPALLGFCKPICLFLTGLFIHYYIFISNIEFTDFVKSSAQAGIDEFN